MKKFWILFFGLLPFSGMAQDYAFRQMQHVKVVAAGDTLTNAWAGGLNCPLFSKIHLNNDTAEDLYVFDRNCNKSFTFLADNTGGTWQWKYAPEYEALFPGTLKFWVLLRDYDNDGRKDIFTSDGFDYLVYRNLTPLNGTLAFGGPRILKYGNFNARMDFDVYSLPSLTDVDNDGDLDILAFSTGSLPTSIIYFRNQSKELFNHTDSLKFTKVTDVWGGIRRCTDFQNYTFGNSSCRIGGITHTGGSSLLALDLDTDLDKDLLVGVETNPELVRFINSGNVIAPAFSATGFTNSFPAATPANFINYPTAYSEDVTFDGMKDLLVAPFLHDNADKANLTHSSWLYRNNAFAPGAAPVFTFQQNNFLQEEMIDVGESAAPVFFDMDADGDQDLLVSNYADYRTGATSFKSTVSLFTNIGTLSKPLFQLTDSDYLNFSAAASNAGYKGLKLQFADVDGNGSKDMIIRYMDAAASLVKVGYIPNSGQPANPFSLVNLINMAVDLNNTDSPFFYDLDGDGDLDILLGTNKVVSGSAGVLHFSRRVGNDVTQYASWEPTFNTNVGNILRSANPAYFNPLIADVNNDNVPELLTTDNSGTLRIYPDILTNLMGTVFPQTGLVSNDMVNQQVATALGNLDGFGARINLHTAVADLDGDSRPEIVVGTLNGGLVYLKNQSALGIAEEADKTEPEVQVFPNPAKELITVNCSEKITVALFDATGKEVKLPATAFRAVHQIRVSGLKAGIYFLKLVTEDFRSYGRRILIAD